MSRIVAPPIVEVLTLDEILLRLAALRDGVEDRCDEYEHLWQAMDQRRQELISGMSDADLTQVELLRAEE